MIRGCSFCRTALAGLTILIASPCPPAIRAQSPEAWTPAFQLRYGLIGETAVSPDGSLVAFVVRTAVTTDDGAEFRRRVWLASSDGAWSRPVTSVDHSSRAPAFSSDGQNLAFLSARSGADQVWVLTLQGGEPRRLTRAPLGITQFKWSPLPQRLAYVAPDPNSAVATQAHEHGPLLRSVIDGEANSHLFILDTDDWSADFPEAVQVSWGAFHIGDFDWAPSGTRIAAVRLPRGSPNAAFGESDLMALNLIGRGLRRSVRLASMTGTERGPRWSPDGRWIAFTGSGERPEPIGLGDVYIVPAEGGEPKRLASTPERSGGTPIGWTPDGQAVLVAEPVATSVHVMAVPVDGSAPRQITQGGGFREGFSLSSGAGLLAFSHENPNQPPETHLLDLRSGRVAQVSDVNGSVKHPPMGDTKVMAWRASDGTQVEGLLTLPPGAAEGRPYPLAVVLHSGPAAAFSATFTGRPETYMVQSLAQRGFAVLRPNPRGSTGYGPEFRHASVGDWGGGDADDVLSGVDEAIRLGVAHPDSLVVLGWGYGGYLAATLTARTDRFKAASVGAPLISLASLAATTDIPDYLTAYMGSAVWENADPYVRHSVLPKLSQIETPTQIFHGASDTRIPLSQSRAIHSALARRGVETELLLLKGATAPNRPDILLALQESLHRWLDGHLSPALSLGPPQRPPRQPRRTSFILSEYEPYGEPGSGAIEGTAYLVMPNGSRRYCTNGLVFMNPVTTLSTEWYQRNVIAREELEPIPLTGYHWIAPSDGEGRFRFVDLPEGDYYLGCRVLPEEGFAHGRVTVGDGETVSVDLVRWVTENGFGSLDAQAPAETAQWGQLSGVWSCTIPSTDSEGVVSENKGTWTWEYILGGTAVRDVYVGLNPDGSARFRGSAIRIFNPERSEWEVSWVDTGSPGTKTYRATYSEDRIVMTKTEDDPDWRTVFYNITNISFDWLNEPSGGRMRCERNAS